jgi:hypothetical protein
MFENNHKFSKRLGKVGKQNVPTSQTINIGQCKHVAFNALAAS